MCITLVCPGIGVVVVVLWRGSVFLVCMTMMCSGFVGSGVVWWCSYVLLVWCVSVVLVWWWWCGSTGVYS